MHPESDIPQTASPDELRKAFIDLGGNPGWKSFQAAEHEARSRAKERKREADKQNPFTHSSQQITQAFANIAVRFVRAVIVRLMPVGLLLLLVAEGVAVYEGISILTHQGTAIIYSVSLMIFLVTIMFIHEIVARSTEHQPQYELSLYVILQRLKRMLGWGTPQERYSSSLSMIVGALRVVSWTIILLGIFGRMRPLIEETQSQPWHQVLMHILTQSNFEQFGGYVSNLLIGLTMLAGTHVIVFLIHRAYVLATGGLDITSDNALDFLSPTSEDELYQQELSHAYRTQIYLLQANQRKKLASTMSASPELLQAPIENSSMD